MPIMPHIFITQYTVFPAQQKMAAYYRDTKTGGSNMYEELSEASPPLDNPGYTNASICIALAAKLGLSSSAVAMDPVPEPVDEPLADEDDAV